MKRRRRTRGDAVAELGPGASAYVSGSTPHTFSNPGLSPVRFLLVCSPGGSVATGDLDAVSAISERFGYAAVTGNTAADSLSAETVTVGS